MRCDFVLHLKCVLVTLVLQGPEKDENFDLEVELAKLVSDRSSRLIDVIKFIS